MNIDTTKLSRVTLVEGSKRVYEKFGINVDVMIQDEGRTLKVFVNKTGGDKMEQIMGKYGNSTRVRFACDYCEATVSYLDCIEKHNGLDKKGNKKPSNLFCDIICFEKWRDEQQ